MPSLLVGKHYCTSRSGVLRRLLDSPATTSLPLPANTTLYTTRTSNGQRAAVTPYSPPPRGATPAAHLNAAFHRIRFRGFGTLPHDARIWNTRAATFSYLACLLLPFWLCSCLPFTTTP